MSLHKFIAKALPFRVITLFEDFPSLYEQAKAYNADLEAGVVELTDYVADVNLGGQQADAMVVDGNRGNVKQVVKELKITKELMDEVCKKPGIHFTLESNPT